MEVIFGMTFLIVSKVEVDFAKKQFIQKTYISAEALPTIKRVQIIGLKEFAKVVLDSEQEIFVVHVLTFFPHLEQRVQIAALITDKASIIVLAEYLDFKNVFSKASVAVLSKNTQINIHTIDLKKNKQPPYGPIYSLGPMKLKTLKTYIKIKLANGFICFSKFLAGTPILFNKKLNRSFWLCINYQSINKITIKNQYLLLLISKFLNCLGYAKQFIQLDLINAYHRMSIKGDKQKIAFQTQYGYFEYQVMLFGPTNILKSF